MQCTMGHAQLCDIWAPLMPLIAQAKEQIEAYKPSWLLALDISSLGQKQSTCRLAQQAVGCAFEVRQSVLGDRASELDGP